MFSANLYIVHTVKSVIPQKNARIKIMEKVFDSSSCFTMLAIHAAVVVSVSQV